MPVDVPNGPRATTPVDKVKLLDLLYDVPLHLATRHMVRFVPQENPKKTEENPRLWTLDSRLQNPDLRPAFQQDSAK